MGEDLVWCTHLKETSTGVEVRVEDSLNDGLDLWCLDKIQDLELDGNLERVTTIVVLLEHDLCEEVLIVNGLDVLNNHELDLVHQLSASVTQTEELLRQKEE